MSGLAYVRHTNRVLSVSHDGCRFDLHAMWLRDACMCASCRNPVSNERLFDSALIPSSIELRSVERVGTTFEIGLSDGHVALISESWLIEHLDSRDMADGAATGQRLWDDETRIESLGGDAAAICASSEACLEWFNTLHESGLAWAGPGVDGERGLREIATLFGPIQQSNYGDVWTVDATIRPETAVDSTRPLRVHTDLPYRHAAPGLQLMMVEADGVIGGHSTFVDGFAVAEHIRTADPRAWHLLTTVEFSYPYIRDDVEVHGRAPLVGRHASGAYSQIRRAPDLVGVPYVSAADTPALYDALRLWDSLIDSERYTKVLNLQAGHVVVWNNHRILHGRTGFTLDANASRLLRGCYADLDDFLSARACLRR